MHRAFRIFAYFAVSAFVLGSVGYLILHALLPRGYVFGGLYRMFRYHEAHPFQYIGVVALTYAALATPCAILRSQLTGGRRVLLIFAVITSTIFVASVPGGILWKIHDMQAGFFTTGSRFWSDLLWGAATGLQTGWLVIALSLPYNVIGVIIGYAVTNYGFKMAASKP